MSPVFRRSGQSRFCCRWLALLCGLLLPVSLQAQAWVDAARLGTEVRFLFGNAVRRYDLATRTWLPPVTLPRAGATAFAWDAQNCYVAYGPAIYSYSPALTGESLLASVSSSTHGLFVDGNLLIAVHSSGYFTRLKVFDRTSGAQLSTNESNAHALFGASHAPGLNKLFGRTQGVYPSDIVVSEYTDAGIMGDTRDSPYYSTYPDAARTWVFPGEGKVVDSAGSLYLTSDLTYAGNLNGTVTDIAFNGDVPVVLRGDLLIAFNNTLVEAGRKTLGFASGAEVQVDDTSAFVFQPGATGPLVEIVPLTDLNAPPPGQPLDPNTLAFTPHTIFEDRDGLIGLYSRNHQTVFRWSPELKAYTSSLAVSTTTPLMAYSAVNHRLYMADGVNLRQMEAEPGSAVTPFAALTAPLEGLATAGEFVITAATGGNRSYSPSGTPIEGGSGYYEHGAWNEWDPVKRRMYHFLDASPSNLLYDTIGADGRITGTAGTPYHGGFIVSAPIRVSPDGALVALGSGRVFTTNSLTFAANLETTLTDMAWHNGQLVSLEPQGSTVTRVQRWSATWGRELSLLLNGAPLRIVPLSAERLLVVTLHAGKPRFHLLDEDLLLQFDSVGEPPVIVTQPMPARVDFRATVTLTVEAVGSPPLSYQWMKGGVPQPGQDGPSLTLTEAGSPDAAEYKVAVSNDFGSVTSNGAMVSVGPVRSPLFTAGNLLISSGGRIFEYTPAGINVQVIAVPVPTANTPASRPVSDAVSDRFGRVHVFNEGRDTFNNKQYYISTFDPDRGTWTHSLTPGFNLSDITAGDLAIAGDWIYARDGRVNLTTGIFEKFNLPDSIVYSELSAGLDGQFYTCERFGEVNRLSPALTVINKYQFGSGIDLRGIGADTAGNIFVSDLAGRLGAYSVGGALIKWFTPPGTYGFFYDISLSATGRIAAGGSSGRVAVSDSSLNSAISINPGTSSGSYTSWVAAVEMPMPSLVATPAPPAAMEDTLYEWTPQVAHPDPDAVITLTAPILPPWLMVSGNTLAGTPLLAHIGPNTVRLRATDGIGRFTERDFIINVTEVNDTPVARDQNIGVDEDAAPVQVDLTELLSDEETPDAALGFQIIAVAGTAAVPALAGNTLRLTFPPDANGSASVTVRATDAGGLTADSVISISVLPVNDAPVFTAPLADVDAGPAAPDASFDLLPLLRDPDTVDTHTWRITAVSNPDIFASQTVDSAGRLAIRYAPYHSGDSSVTVQVSDTAGTTANLTFNVSLPELPAPQVAVSAALTLNRQTGLWEHRISLRNGALRAIGGFEVRVTNLPAGACLYNASECSPAAPFAGYYAPVAPGEAVTMILEYYNPSRGTLNPELLVSTALPQTPPPAGSGGLAIDGLVAVSGGLLLEFTALPGHLYLVQYSGDNVLWLDSQVRIRAAGNRVQWLDQGPPRTSSPPSSVTHRFYRVKEVTGP